MTSAEESSVLSLMPIAMLSFIGSVVLFLSVLRTVLAVATFPGKPSASQELNRPLPTAASKRSLGIKLALAICLALVFAKLNAKITSSSSSLSSWESFDPLEVLELTSDSSLDAAEVKRQYRKLSVVRHPDKPTGSTSDFELLSLAYRALTDPVSMRNFEEHGHPDGPRGASLSFALPTWALRPEGWVAVVLVAVYLLAAAGGVWWVFRTAKGAEEKAVEAAAANSVANRDQEYLTKRLRDNCSHMDVLYFIATTPENLNCVRKAEEEVKKVKKEKEEKKKDENLLDLDDDDDDDTGWGGADDDDDDDNDNDDGKTDQERALERIQKRKEKEHADRLARLTKGGKTDPNEIKIEGFDKGAIGVKWVLDKLTAAKVWPPRIPCLTKNSPTFIGEMKREGEEIDPIVDVKEIRKNVIMLTARLNSMVINQHPELRAASEKGLVDSLYFKESMMFRERVGLLLEASLRYALQSRQHRLACTIIECVTMFKIGIPSAVNPQMVKWFRTMIQRQYGPGVIPSLKIVNCGIATPNETTVAANDETLLTIEFERTHAEAFLKNKLAICAQRKMDPKQFLSTYREGWWVVVTAVNHDEPVEVKTEKKRDDFEKALLEASARRTGQPVPTDDNGEPQFETKKVLQEVLVLAHPMILTDVGKKNIVFKAKFRAPPKAGRYTFRAKFKSSEFIGSDNAVDINVRVLTEEEAKAKAKEDDSEKDGEKEEEDGEKEEQVTLETKKDN